MDELEYKVLISLAKSVRELKRISGELKEATADGTSMTDWYDILNAKAAVKEVEILTLVCDLIEHVGIIENTDREDWSQLVNEEILELDPQDKLDDEEQFEKIIKSYISGLKIEAKTIYERFLERKKEERKSAPLN